MQSWYVYCEAAFQRFLASHSMARTFYAIVVSQRRKNVCEKNAWMGAQCRSQHFSSWNSTRIFHTIFSRVDKKYKQKSDIETAHSQCKNVKKRFIAHYGSEINSISRGKYRGRISSGERFKCAIRKFIDFSVVFLSLTMLGRKFSENLMLFMSSCILQEQRKNLWIRIRNFQPAPHSPPPPCLSAPWEK